VWDAEGRPLYRVRAEVTGAFDTVEFSPDGRLLVYPASKSSLQVCDAATGAPRYAIAGTEGWENQAKFNPDGRLLGTVTEGEKRTLVVREAATGTAVLTLPGVYGPYAFTPDGRGVLTGRFQEPPSDRDLTLWDVATGDRLRVFEGHTGLVWDAAFSPDGQ